jgi:hypothetical protein
VNTPTLTAQTPNDNKSLFSPVAKPFMTALYWLANTRLNQPRYALTSAPAPPYSIDGAMLHNQL